MIIIAHRGNTAGPNPHLENKPSYIDEAISSGYFAEIDLWFRENYLFLGHDSPDYLIDLSWLIKRSTHLYIHAKDLLTVMFLKNLNFKLNFFFHQNDECTITSKGEIWIHPESKPFKGSIFVMPELSSVSLEEIKESECFAICTDFADKYNNLTK